MPAPLAAVPVRVGVGTGEVITPVGTPADLREIAGAALDVAGRLKEVAEPGAVMAGERTCRVAGASFEFAEPVRLADASGRELGPRLAASRGVVEMRASS